VKEGKMLLLASVPLSEKGAPIMGKRFFVIGGRAWGGPPEKKGKKKKFLSEELIKCHN